MSETPEKHDAAMQNEQGDVDQHDISTRREMIQRYAKVAVAASPLLLFVSKAKAIHSKP